MMFDVVEKIRKELITALRTKFPAGMIGIHIENHSYSQRPHECETKYVLVVNPVKIMKAYDTLPELINAVSVVLEEDFPITVERLLSDDGIYL